MTLAIALTANVLLSVALLGGLAYVMTSPRKLAAHGAEAQRPTPRVRERAVRPRTARRLAPAASRPLT